MRDDPPEPILTDEDRACWRAWERAALEHARTQAHRRLVERSRAAVLEALALPDARRPALSWSGGKDSTACAALACIDCGAADRIDLVSEKDDLDYPGERAYVERWAAAWGAKLTILEPSISPRQWIQDAAERGEIASYDDIHTRAAGLSKACFYGLMEADNASRGLVVLGLRAKESNVRKMVARKAMGARTRAQHTGMAWPASGLTYRHTGMQQWRCLPVAWWDGIDVYAYLLSRGIDPLPVYRCLALMHRDKPWMLRKSWWLPGAYAADGQVAWLRRYYPSLYRQLCDWMPDARLLG